MHSRDIPPDYRARIDRILNADVEGWDASCKIPEPILRELGSAGLLCPQVSSRYGGLGCSSLLTGEMTAAVGRRCGSIRSLMTSQGMAAWAVQQLGDQLQKQEYLRAFVTGQLAAMAFTESHAGSDLSAISTQIQQDGSSIRLSGQKVWVTGGRYADLVVVTGRLSNDEVGAVVVPTSSVGVDIVPIENPLGCRAAGHATINLNDVQLPAESLLGGGGYAPSVLFTTALTYGRLSVAWGCVGIIRGCLTAAAEHAKKRRQFNRQIAEHQLIQRHLARLVTSERIATQVCTNASNSWDSASAGLAFEVLLAKYVSSQGAARSASIGVQVLASAGARNGDFVARAYRDAKLMELIEGSNEICELVLADYALNPPGSLGAEL